MAPGYERKNGKKGNHRTLRSDEPTTRHEHTQTLHKNTTPWRSRDRVARDTGSARKHLQERPSDREVMGASPVVLSDDVVTQARTGDREVMGASPVVLSADVVTCVPSENKRTLGTECKHNPTTNPKKQGKTQSNV